MSCRVYFEHTNDVPHIHEQATKKSNTTIFIQNVQHREKTQRQFH